MARRLLAFKTNVRAVTYDIFRRQTVAKIGGPRQPRPGPDTETIRYKLGKSCQQRVTYVPTLPHNSNDGSFPTRASLNDRQRESAERPQCDGCLAALEQ